MFTDMVGYTALMQEDEGRAKRDRNRHREVLRKHIQSYRGSLLQYYGDVTLTIFESSIEAVKAALEISWNSKKSLAVVHFFYQWNFDEGFKWLEIRVV